MQAQLEIILSNLLSAENDLIKKATADLTESFKHPDTVPALCELAVSNPKPQIRQYAAVILGKRLRKLRYWQMLLPDQHKIIKDGMLRALVQEQEKSVRNSIAQFIGVMVGHEDENNNAWMVDVLNFIYTHCSSSDPKESELGSSIFATLTGAAPDQFISHIDPLCQMFNAALVATDASGNMATPVILNITLAMTNIMPFVLGRQEAEHTMTKSIPLIVKALRAFSIMPDVDQFVRAFDIIETISEYTPKLLANHFMGLIDFCIEISSNTLLDDAVRVKTIVYIGWMVHPRKKVLTKQQMIEPILQVLFNLLSVEPDSDDDDTDDYFIGGCNCRPMNAATQALDALAMHVPSDKLIPPLLQIMEPALKSQDPLPRRAAYMCMAVISESCSDAICRKYLETMLNIIKVGISDPMPIVRSVAFYTLGQFSEHLQPEISKYAPQILPVLFQFLHQLCLELRTGGPEPKHIGRMFYALETFCENLGEDLIPHLPVLMECLFDALNPKNSWHVRELTFTAISAAANAAKESMLPYFPQLIDLLHPYLIKSTTTDIINLRAPAIHSLAAISRAIGKDNFMPLATDTMNFALELLGTDDPDVRRALYNLIASIAAVVNEEMASVFPKIMNRIFESILSNNEVVPDCKDESYTAIYSDSEDTETDDDDCKEGSIVENSFLDEKQEAILALREFAEYTGAAFIPYIQQSFECVYKMLDHPHEEVRKVCIDTMTSLIIALHRQSDMQGVSNAINPLLKKISQIIHDDEDFSVVTTALENMSDIFLELKEISLPGDELREIVFACVTDIFNSKIACQFDEPSGGGDEEEECDTEFEEVLVETAGKLLSLFGSAMQSHQFAMYFGRVYQLLLKKLERANKNSLEDQRSFAYGALAECFEPLGKYTGNFFDVLCPVFIAGLSDKFNQARQNAIYGLGELVLFAGEKSYEAFPIILQTLSEAISNESEPGAIDNVCGAIARLILTNYSLVPLIHVLPVFLQNLPLREDFDENDLIVKSLKLLYVQARPSVISHIEKILAIIMHILYFKQYCTSDTYECVIAFINELRHNYPDSFTSVANSNAEIAAFVRNM